MSWKAEKLNETTSKENFLSFLQDFLSLWVLRVVFAVCELLLIAWRVWCKIFFCGLSKNLRFQDSLGVIDLVLNFNWLSDFHKRQTFWRFASKWSIFLYFFGWFEKLSQYTHSKMLLCCFIQLWQVMAFKTWLMCLVIASSHQIPSTRVRSTSQDGKGNRFNGFETLFAQ